MAKRKRKKNISTAGWIGIGALAVVGALGYAGYAAAKKAKKALDKLKSMESYSETTNGWKIDVERRDIQSNGETMPRYFAYVTPPGPGVERESVGNDETGYTTMNEALNAARALVSEASAPSLWDWPTLPPGFEQLAPVDQGRVEAPDGYSIEWQLLDIGGVPGADVLLVVYRSTQGHGFQGVGSAAEAQQYVTDIINQQK